jgi:hypothetical protein
MAEYFLIDMRILYSLPIKHSFIWQINIGFALAQQKQEILKQLLIFNDSEFP